MNYAVKCDSCKKTLSGRGRPNKTGLCSKCQSIERNYNYYYQIIKHPGIHKGFGTDVSGCEA